MKEIQIDAGESISSAAQRMITEAANGDDVFCIFNGICVPASKSDTVNTICDTYDRLSEIRRKEYQNSPEGIAMAKKQEEERNRLQSKADFLMAELPVLDFSDTDLLIKWLCDIEEARDRIGVNVDAKEIRRQFITHGFYPNAYTDDAFIKGNPEIERRWLIGQAIADVYVPMVRHFAEKLQEAK